MFVKEEISFYSYYQILNKTIIKSKVFHFIFITLDSIILLIKIIDIYHTNYNINPSSIKYINLSYLMSEFPIIIKLLPLIVYLILGYVIIIIYLLTSIQKLVNKCDKIVINIFEFFIIRFLFIFIFELLFDLSSYLFFLFLILSMPFLAFIFFNFSFFHLTGFMLKIVEFPYDNFSSICEVQKTFIKIIIAISETTQSPILSKLMFFFQFVIMIICLIYNTYVIFYKSYYLMNNELFSKTRYSNLLSSVVIQLFMFLLKPEEIYSKSYIINFIGIYIFIL